MMKRLLLGIIFGIYFTTACAQSKMVSAFPSRLHLSFETVAMSTEADLGFMGIGYEVLEVLPKFKPLYLGLHSYSAITGSRPGLITLGMSAGLRFPIIKKSKFYIDGGFFIGGGGGGGADDGGGLILRPHISLEKQLGSIGLRAGYSQIDFPTGAIRNSQFHLGLTFNNTTYLQQLSLANTANATIGLAFERLRMALVASSYINLSADSVTRTGREEQPVGLLGAQLEYGLNDYWYAIAKTNGALIGDTDGYMSIFIGLGMELPILNNRLKIEPRVLFGPTGGGDIQSGGGATAQYEIGPAYYFNKGFYIKSMVGKTQSPWGDLKATHVEFALGKSLGRIVPKLTDETKSFKIPESKVKTNHMSIAVYNRTYFSPDALDKGDNPYLNTFNLLCFEGQQYLSRKISLNAATVWAYEGDYGAYAEGLIGTAYHESLAKNLKITLKGLTGAAGGGGIRLGSGLIFQYLAGLDYAFGKRASIFMNVGKFQPLSGNFDPILLDAGVKIDLYQLFKS